MLSRPPLEWVWRLEGRGFAENRPSLMADRTPRRRGAVLKEGYSHSSISDKEWYAYALNEIALQMAQRGERWEAQNLWKQALLLARGCEDTFISSCMFREIAEAHAKAGYTKEAQVFFEEAVRRGLETDHGLEDPEGLIATVACAQAGVGMLSESLRTARRLALKPHHYAKTLVRIADALLHDKSSVQG